MGLWWIYRENQRSGQIYKWKNLTAEIIQELFIARERLRAPGTRTDLQPRNKNHKVQTWTQYCEDIGSSRQVVDRWLKRYFQPAKYELPYRAPRKSSLWPSIPSEEERKEYESCLKELREKYQGDDKAFLDMIRKEHLSLYFHFFPMSVRADSRGISLLEYIDKGIEGDIYREQENKRHLEEFLKDCRKDIVRANNKIERLVAHLIKYKDYYGSDYYREILSKHSLDASTLQDLLKKINTLL